MYKPARQELEVEFGEQFSKLLGRFIYCADEHELKQQLAAVVAHNGWKNIYFNEIHLGTLLPPEVQGLATDTGLSDAEAAITGCEALVARTGSIILSSAQRGGRSVSVYAPVHICIAFTGQLVYDVRDGLQLIREKYKGSIPSLVTFATGPSRTADIEKTLVVGVHGPKEVYVFLLERDER